MSDRKGVDNRTRFPERKDAAGKYLCRLCGKALPGRKRSFCDRRCLRDYFMLTDWQRVRNVVFERDGGICMECGAHLHKRDSRYWRDGKFVLIKKTPWHVDHIIPIATGGAEWDLANLELLCEKCNLSKGAKIDPHSLHERLT